MRQARTTIYSAIENLRDSMQLDVNNLLKDMLNETDEAKQIKNIDFIFRVCIPLYFLSDVRQRSDQDLETIKAILLNSQYQMLIKRGLSDYDRTIAIDRVFSQFIQHPNDSNNMQELSEILKNYKGTSV